MREKSIGVIRRFRATDESDELDDLALTAWSEYRPYYLDWERARRTIANMSSLSSEGDVFVFLIDNALVGAVAYMPPRSSRADYFDADWALIRMLVVHPNYRGRGVGRALTLTCIERARSDGVEILALHTSTMMRNALNLYQRMGFNRAGPAPSDTVFPYSVYTLKVDSLNLRATR